MLSILRVVKNDCNLALHIQRLARLPMFMHRLHISFTQYNGISIHSMAAAIGSGKARSDTYI